MSLSNGNVDPVSKHYSVRFMDIGEGGEDFHLFRAFPFFVDVLEWLDGTRPFTSIRHRYSEVKFREDILPVLINRLRHKKLVRFADGRLLPNFGTIVLRNIPTKPSLPKDVIQLNAASMLKECLRDERTPKYDFVSTRAKPEFLLDWLRRFRMLLGEIEDHDDPAGVPFMLNAFRISAI